MRIFIACFLLAFSLSSVAKNECKVNVLNVVCLGGSLIKFKSHYGNFRIENGVGVKSQHVHISKRSTNLADAKFFEELKYENIDFVSLEVLEDKVYDVQISFKSPQVGGINKIDRGKLIVDLTLRYGEPHINDASGEFGADMFTWKARAYSVDLFCTNENYCYIRYYIPNIVEKSVVESGL